MQDVPGKIRRAATSCKAGKCVKRLSAFAKDMLDRRTWDNDEVNCVVSVLHYGFA